jgi:hypothetical protein
MESYSHQTFAQGVVTFGNSNQHRNMKRPTHPNSKKKIHSHVDAFGRAVQRETI